MTRAGSADRWALSLCVNGASPHSIQAIENARRLCEEELDGQVDLEIIDVQQEPAVVARDATLVRRALNLGPLKMSDKRAAPNA